MSKIKFSKKESTSAYKDLYEVTINLSGWELSHELTEREIIQLRDSINEQLGLSEIAKQFNISIAEAEKIKQFQKNQWRCKKCPFKMIACDKCVLVCQSPLEQDLLLALQSVGVEAKLQQRVNKDGQILDYDTEVDKDKILTIPDFLYEKNGKKFAIYTDGHTYHERTEYQASRDRNIDRELQLLGFIVLRYTGKEIREKLEEKTLHIYQNIYSEPILEEKAQKLSEYVLSKK